MTDGIKTLYSMTLDDDWLIFSVIYDVNQIVEQSMIDQEIKEIAEIHGLIVKPSTHKNKKLDVYTDGGRFLASIGDDRYKDFWYYRKINKELANQRRDAYYRRHHKDIDHLAGSLAYLLLWDGSFQF